MLIYESFRTNPEGGIYHQRDIGLTYGRHLHNSFEFIHVYDGIFRTQVGDTVYEVRAGESILIFPNQIHHAYASMHSGNPLTYLCIFQNDLVRDFYQRTKGKCPISPVFKISDPTLIERIAACHHSHYLLKAYLYELIHHLVLHCDTYKTQGNLDTEHVGKILLYISEHYTEKIRMQDVAVEIGYNYHYLSTLLQKNLNTTFRSVLNEYRISHAKYLLSTSDNSISHISYECGYESLCSFNRNFRELEGITPSEFRKKVQNMPAREELV